MKLYYASGACSLAPHIVLKESGIMGDTFSVADSYLFVVASWGKQVGIDISGLSKLSAFMARVAARPAVQDALRAEGLIK